MAGSRKLYRLTLDQPLRNTRTRYNVCPTDPIDTIVGRNGKRELMSTRWGLIPPWWSKPTKLAAFNARAETVVEMPFFRCAFKRTRCLIPVSVYYEWQSALTTAGLWDEWHDKASGEKLKTCTLITTEPNTHVS